MTTHSRLAMVATAAMAALMAASVRVFRLEFEGMYIDWQLSEEDGAGVRAPLAVSQRSGSRSAADLAT